MHHVRKPWVVATSVYVETHKEGTRDVVRLSQAPYVSLSYCGLELQSVWVSVFAARSTAILVWHPDHIYLRNYANIPSGIDGNHPIPNNASALNSTLRMR